MCCGDWKARKMPRAQSSCCGSSLPVGWVGARTTRMLGFQLLSSSKSVLVSPLSSVLDLASVVVPASVLVLASGLVPAPVL